MLQIPRSDAKNVWISVNEALPPDFKRVNVLLKSKYKSSMLTIGSLKRIDEEKWEWDFIDPHKYVGHMDLMHEVMYWCNSIPELPEGYTP